MRIHLIALAAALPVVNGCATPGPTQASAHWSEISSETAGTLHPIPQDSLAALRYQDFFDDTATLDYARLLAYRALEDSIPRGLKRRTYYNVLGLLEAYVGNIYEAIKITDRGALEPTTMMMFDSTGAMTEVPFYPESAYAEYSDSLMQADYNATDFAERLRNIPDDIRVFALNEAHTAPLFRSTLYNALPELRRQGFTILAHETLYAEREDFNASSFPARTSGFFSGEVVSGDVFRRAKALGFRLVSYDAQNAGSQQAREEQSYHALMDRTFREDPNARVVLYAGHSHTWTTTIGPIRMLGQQLVDEGIDPLVIHQSRYYERNAPPSLTSPTLFQPNDPTARTVGAYDYILVLPKSHPVHGRPSWLWAMDRQPIALPPTTPYELATPFLVEAFLAAEPETAVPLDRIEVTDQQTAPHLALRPGAYRVRITTPTNAVRELTLTVE
ncbi:MAG: hypothetical protein AAF170_05420 [Bacteroidota bacterium]